MALECHLMRFSGMRQRARKCRWRVLCWRVLCSTTWSARASCPGLPTRGGTFARTL